jgi:uncharacterized membrane protein YhdT
MPRWATLTVILLISAVWLISAYKILTGLRGMNHLDAFNVAMCILVGPLILWQSFHELQKAKE